MAQTSNTNVLNQKAIELKSLSETRWTAQMAACHAVTSRRRLDVILALLGQIGEDSNRDRAVEAHAILHIEGLEPEPSMSYFHRK